MPSRRPVPPRHQPPRLSRLNFVFELQVETWAPGHRQAHWRHPGSRRRSRRPGRPGSRSRPRAGDSIMMMTRNSDLAPAPSSSCPNPGPSGPASGMTRSTGLSPGRGRAAARSESESKSAAAAAVMPGAPAGPMLEVPASGGPGSGGPGTTGTAIRLSPHRSS